MRKFETSTKPDSRDKEVDDYAYILGLPYFGNLWPKFASQLSTLLKQRFNVRVFACYTSLKTGSYFNVKSKTFATSKFNALYKFTCLRDVNATYIGMSTRDLVAIEPENICSLTLTAPKVPLANTFLVKVVKIVIGISCERVVPLLLFVNFGR